METNLLVAEVPHFFVTQGQHSRSFSRHLLVDVVVTLGIRGKLRRDIHVGIVGEAQAALR